MFESIWGFIKRHRKKLFFTGVFVGGVIFLGKYARKKLLEYQDTEAAECLAQFRKQHHFDSNQRNCNTTVLSLLPRLREALCQHLNSEALTAELRTRPTNRVEIWEQLKIVSFTRTMVAIYSSAMLAVVLRVQLNVLGGYMYRDGLSAGANSSNAVVTCEIQKQYLAGIQYLFEQGLTDLIAAVQSSVAEVLGAKSLKDCVSAGDVGDLVRQVRQSVETTRRQNGRVDVAAVAPAVSSLVRFMIPPSVDAGAAADEARYLTSQEVVASRLRSETIDVVHSPDFQIVLTSCLDTGFRWLLARIPESFRSTGGANAVGVNGIVALGSPAPMPFAKVIPVVNGLVHTVLADAPNIFIQELLLKDDVKNFAANVYSAFCEGPPAGRDGCRID